MTKPISQRLREHAEWLRPGNGRSLFFDDISDLDRAADEIERLDRKCAALAYLLYGKPPCTCVPMKPQDFASMTVAERPDCPVHGSAAEPTGEPVRALIEHIEKAGHVYSYEPIFEHARDALIKRADAPCDAVSTPDPLSARCLNCGWLVGNHKAQHLNRGDKHE